MIARRERARGTAERAGVIGIVRDAEQRILLVERSARVRNAGLWCFPGGHVEPGESPERAVERELLEELEIVVQAERHLGIVRVPGSPYRLEVFTVAWLSGEIRPNPSEVADARFLTLDEVAIIGRAMPSNEWVVRLLRA